MATPAVAMILMALSMLIAIQVLSNAAIDSEIKRELARSMEVNIHNISIENEQVKISEKFLYKSEDVYFLVIRKKRELIAGEYPKEAERKLSKYRVRNGYSRSINHNGETYYLRDIRIGRIEGKGIFIRGIIRESDVDSFYRGIEIVSYLVIIGVLSVMLFCEVFLAKRISKELKRMCKIAENVSSSLDMSQRMDGDYRFYEISVLAKANDRMLDRLEQTFLLQEQFTADVAHELRTPVAVISAQCQYAKKKVDSVEEYREVLDVVYRQSKKIDTLITQLLNLSRLDQDRMQIEREELDLVEIVQSVCDGMREGLENNVSVRLNLREAFSTGDISLISIVIQNLIINAAKFSYPDGIIEIETGETEGEAYVAVKDYGIGIAKKNQERIFRRFFKCDESRNVGGFGLGLPLSRKIAEKHGGRITVISEPGKETVFTLYLPVNKR